MKRAAIYARFSSDLQRDKSIEDQVALCREVAERTGLAVVATFADRAISGASTKNRPGFQAMMTAAKSRTFDILIAEDVDRISRDQGHYHEARKRLEFHGIAIHTPHGALGRIDGSLRALMSELYLENLADKTRRGLRGVLRDGRHPGGKAYGYRAVPGKPGVLEIVPEEAAIVREIFRRYAEGESPRKIAADLNARKVLAPRGGKWNASTINGNHKRQSGMLFTELYVGRIVWNRLRMQKDPTTGKRVSRTNEAQERTTVEAPHLRILDDAIWDRARALKRLKHHQSPERARQSPRFLSGLIKCGSCGGSMVSMSRDRKGMRLQCSTHRESGTCNNGRMVYRDDIEKSIVDGLRDLMDDRVCLSEYVRAYNDARRQRAKAHDGMRAQLERRFGEIKRETERVLDAIAKTGVPLEPLLGRIQALEAERAQISADLEAASCAEKVVTLHPGTVERYRADLDRLAGFLTANEGGESDELIAVTRRLIASVVVNAEPGGGPIKIEIRGRLAELLGNDPLLEKEIGRGTVVAGTGVEPATYGL